MFVNEEKVIQFQDIKGVLPRNVLVQLFLLKLQHFFGLKQKVICDITTNAMKVSTINVLCLISEMLFH
jgi:hypothetical protein